MARDGVSWQEQTVWPVRGSAMTGLPVEQQDVTGVEPGTVERVADMTGRWWSGSAAAEAVLRSPWRCQQQ